MTRWAPWVLLVAVVGLALFVVYRLNAGRAAIAELARRDAIAELEPEVDRILAENDELRAAMASAKLEHPGAEAVAVAQATTGTITAHGAPRPPDPPNAPEPPDLVSEGDQLEAKVVSVALQDRKGETWLEGTVEPWRVKPEPRTSLGRASFEFKLDLPPPPVPLARWGAGPAVFLDPGGLAYGIAVAAPPLRVFGWELGVQAAGGAGRDGWRGMAAVIVRP